MITEDRKNNANETRFTRVQYTVWKEQLSESIAKAERNVKRNKKLSNDHKGTDRQAKYTTLAFKWEHKLKACKTLMEFIEERAL